MSKHIYNTIKYSLIYFFALLFWQTVRSTTSSTTATVWSTVRRVSTTTRSKGPARAATPPACCVTVPTATTARPAPTPTPHSITGRVDPDAPPTYTGTPSLESAKVTVQQTLGIRRGLRASSYQQCEMNKNENRVVLSPTRTSRNVTRLYQMLNRNSLVYFGRQHVKKHLVSVRHVCFEFSFTVFTALAV